MNRILLASLVLVSLALVGCQDHVKAPYYGRSDPYERTQIFFSGTYGDQLEKQTAVGQSIVSLSDGMMKVTIPIRSAVNKSLYVEYQVTYLDGTGQKLGEIAWQPVTLEANAPKEVSFTIPDPRARDFRAVFRYQR